MMNISDLQPGFELPELRRTITQAMIDRYARASRDYNPIHIDPEFAAKTAAGGTIAHGMLDLAFCSQMVTQVFGQRWLEGGRFNIRFKMPARPGDVLTVKGKVEKVARDESGQIINCTILCVNQKGETIISGEAVVRL